jgi:nicotinamidase/pyrazinamidase
MPARKNGGTKMRKILIVIDMQNDFISGALGTPEAKAIVEQVVAEIGRFAPGNIFATRDTHSATYLETQEGQRLPVPHCIKGTPGWALHPKIAAALLSAPVFDKPTFGSLDLAQAMARLAEQEAIDITLVGLCTDICVVSNALLLKAYLPEVPIRVKADCCAGVTRDTHLAALETMQMCQIIVE